MRAGARRLIVAAAAVQRHVNLQPVLHRRTAPFPGLLPVVPVRRAVITLGSETLLLLAALAFSLAYNGALWHRLFAGRDLIDPRQLALAAGAFVAVTALQFAGLALLPRRAIRPALALLFPATAVASYYMTRFEVFLDSDMLRNVLHTDPAEATELLTTGLVTHLVLFGLLPAIALAFVRLAPRPPARALGIRAAAIAMALVATVVAVLPQYQSAAALVRGHHDARHLVTPTNYLASLYRLARDRARAPGGALTPLGTDAHRVTAVAASRRPTLFVLVVGETVRSANFGLSGYARQTTPELAALDPIVFPRVAACGTSTEVSLPCMFAPVGRRRYDEDRIRGQESLLHVLRRGGFQVRWIDNQSGCKGVCAGLPAERIGGAADPALCDGERCLDGVLLPRLAQAAAGERGDLVVVLHMLGNHGPVYSHRYPPQFRRYTPTCEDADLGACSHQQVVNAYDNAVLYTDHVLATTIGWLQQQRERDTALVYVSDHGESLGENGFYLHGLPYGIAPREQREVPMVMWFSSGFATSARLDLGCLAQRTREPATHDHLFHSVLGLLGVATRVREPALDIFASCREQPSRV